MLLEASCVLACSREQLGPETQEEFAYMNSFYLWTSAECSGKSGGRARDGSKYLPPLPTLLPRLSSGLAAAVGKVPKCNLLQILVLKEQKLLNHEEKANKSCHSWDPDKDALWLHFL